MMRGLCPHASVYHRVQVPVCPCCWLIVASGNKPYKNLSDWVVLGIPLCNVKHQKVNRHRRFCLSNLFTLKEMLYRHLYGLSLFKFQKFPNFAKISVTLNMPFFWVPVLNGLGFRHKCAHIEIALAKNQNQHVFWTRQTKRKLNLGLCLCLVFSVWCLVSMVRHTCGQPFW